MSVTTAFNKLLAIPGAWAATVTFAAEGAWSVCAVGGGGRCASAGWNGRAIYDGSVRRWRHIGLAAWKLFLEAEIRRLYCRRCARVRTEAVDWARPAARHTRDFEDVVAWLCQHTEKATVTKLLGTSWETVAGIVGRVVAEQIDTRRLDDICRIGVDEVSWRKGHRYLTVVADHYRGGAAIWAGEGRDNTVLELLHDELGPDGCTALEAVSLDMGGAYEKSTNLKTAQAHQCVVRSMSSRSPTRRSTKAASGVERRTSSEPDTEGAPKVGRRRNRCLPPNKPRWVKHTRLGATQRSRRRPNVGRHVRWG